MMWMWISSIVILFGAELNSEIEHQTAAVSASDYFQIPPKRVVELGTQVEL
jgi:uncharacterized BrkB/YihY/UPF0761 family membrane protein